MNPYYAPSLCNETPCQISLFVSLTVGVLWIKLTFLLLAKPQSSSHTVHKLCKTSAQTLRNPCIPGS
jgi:hypothetical protein